MSWTSTNTFDNFEFFTECTVIKGIMTQIYFYKVLHLHLLFNSNNVKEIIYTFYIQNWNFIYTSKMINIWYSKNRNWNVYYLYEL